MSTNSYSELFRQVNEETLLSKIKAAWASTTNDGSCKWLIVLQLYAGMYYLRVSKCQFCIHESGEIMKKILFICSVMTIVTIAGSMTAEAKHTETKHTNTKTVKAEKATTLEAMTVVGTVEKVEKTNKNGPDAKFPFKLTDADGKVVYLPRGEVDQYVGKKVKITGQGTYSDKGGKSFKTITKIEKADAAPATPEK
jgi:hypothetical protein